MRNYPFILLIFLPLLFLSCNTPMDRVYSKTSYSEDIESIRQSQKISDDDIELLARYIALSNLSGNDLEGKTYDDILDKIKEIRKTNTDSNDRLSMEKDAKRDRMNPFLAVNLTEKIFSKDDDKNYMKYTITFQNLSARNIKMVIGTMHINDLMEREIKKLNIVLDEELGANTTLQKTFTFGYNDSDENDQQVRVKPVTGIRIEWNPEKIIFDDGRVME